MVKVRLLRKFYEGDESKREEIDSKDFDTKKNYKELIAEIKKAFNIKTSSGFTLLASDEEDEYPIENQDDLDSYKDTLKEYLIIYESDKIFGKTDKKITCPSSMASSSKKNKEEEKEEEREEEKDKLNDSENDEPLNEDNQIEIGGEKINFDLNLDIKDSEIEKIIDSQIKEIPPLSEDINDDIQFNIDEYKKGLNDNEKNILNDFQKIFDSKIEAIVNSKSQILKKKVDASLLEFSKINLNNLNEINKEAIAITDDFKEIMGNTGAMNDAMIELSEVINTGKQTGNRNTIIREEDNDDDDEKNKICFKFNKDKMDIEKSAKDAKFITIDNIIIENIGSKNKKYDKLYFVLDKNKSDKDITYDGYSNKNLLVHQLTTKEGFIYGKPEEHSLTLQIKNPENDKIYTAYIYIIENNKEDSPQLSNPLEINIKIKKEETDNKEAQKYEAIQLYNEYDESTKISEFISKEEAIKEFMQLNNNKNLIEEWIKEKREEKNKKKGEDLYNELKEFKLEENNFNRDEILNKIKELNYDKEKVVGWIKDEINKKKKEKAEKIYATLNVPENLNKDDVLNKIIDLEFNEEEINKWLDCQRKEDNSGQNNTGGGKPNPAPAPGYDEERMQKLLDMLDNEYNILSIVDEEEVKAKILDLNYNEDSIRDWINIKLSE